MGRVINAAAQQIEQSACKKTENPVFGNQVKIKTTIDCNGVILFIENADIFDLTAPDKWQGAAGKWLERQQNPKVCTLCFPGS
ncbi:hypothetical protein TH25_13825 [Thalassospira profundimaris]|uniref:Uncharacterized protein n=1 Tax=Thalassospira profundimaris TaxID=502049 RepID=A0A367X4U4_9PROT|nr:hypothetical protein TH25_13825 [Thalassospira profundimaris]